MRTILKLNEISNAVNEVFAPLGYKLDKDCKNPDAILLRSFNMHGYEVPPSEIGRAHV